MTKVPVRHRPARRALVAAVTAWMAATVILSLLAWWSALGDSPVINTTHVSLVQVLLTAGSVVSPPAITTVLAGLLLWWALSRSIWLSRAGTVLLLAGIALTGWDTAGGLHARAAGYSPAKWDAVLVIGWAYVLVCVLTVLACMVCLIRSPAGRARSAAGQPRRSGDGVPGNPGARTWLSPKRWPGQRQDDWRAERQVRSSPCGQIGLDGNGAEPASGGTSSS